MSDLPLPGRLRALAGDLIRLAPSRTDPERYHIEKDRIATALRSAAREAEWTPRPRAALPMVSRPPQIASPAAGIACPSTDCRHCRRRCAAQSRRHRLRLPDRDLFTWAETR